MKISLPHCQTLMFVLFFSVSTQIHAAKIECDILTSQYNIRLPGNINIQRDTPDNQPITEWIDGGGSKDLYHCKKGKYWNVFEEKTATNTGKTFSDNGIAYNIYKTNIDGVGIIVRARSQGAETMSKYYSYPFGRWIPGWYHGDLTVKFEADARLIKIGAIDGDELGGTSIGTIYVLDYSTSQRIYPVNVTVSGSKLKVLACSVNNPVVNVKFNQAIAKRDFKGVGHKLPSIPIPFTLTCNAGARVNVTINADKDTSLPENGLIKIQQGVNKATGLAIQVTDKDENGLAIGQNFISGTSTSDGVYDLGLRARYVQTAKIVSPGAVNGIATINLTYN